MKIYVVVTVCCAYTMGRNEFNQHCLGRMKDVDRYIYRYQWKHLRILRSERQRQIHCMYNIGTINSGKDRLFLDVQSH